MSNSLDIICKNELHFKPRSILIQFKYLLKIGKHTNLPEFI